MNPPINTFNQNNIDTMIALLKNVIGKDTDTKRKFETTKINIALFDYHPPILIPILALSKAPLIGAVVDIKTNTEQVTDLLMPKVPS